MTIYKVVVTNGQGVWYEFESTSRNAKAHLAKHYGPQGGASCAVYTKGGKLLSSCIYLDGFGYRKAMTKNDFYKMRDSLKDEDEKNPVMAYTIVTTDTSNYWAYSTHVCFDEATLEKRRNEAFAKAKELERTTGHKFQIAVIADPRHCRQYYELGQKYLVNYTVESDDNKA